MSNNYSAWFDVRTDSAYVVKNSETPEFMRTGACIRTYAVETARKTFSALAADGFTPIGSARLVPGGFVVSLEGGPQ